jgi:hypothetical protein
MLSLTGMLMNHSFMSSSVVLVTRIFAGQNPSAKYVAAPVPMPNLIVYSIFSFPFSIFES